MKSAFHSPPEQVPLHASAAPVPADATGPAAGDAPGQAGLSGPADVLLVEDNPINQVVALEFLSLMGLQSRLACDGHEALAQCAQRAPDLVLMDIQMPGMDGLECARRLRELQRRGELAHFPILALTAHALEADVLASMNAGMDEHLTKPLDFVALRNRLSRWLKLPGLSS